jgi:hypothetical protein
MLQKICRTNFFHIKFWVVVASNVKMDQCCSQLRFFILMVRLYMASCIMFNNMVPLLFFLRLKFIISLLISPLLGHSPSLKITHKENGP